jgi:chromate transporter
MSQATLERMSERQSVPASGVTASRHVGEVFFAFARLGVSSFGGPIAHLGYFREEFVGRRGWLDDERFTGLVALANTLPGPSSSQVGLLIGYYRAGVLGAAAAWLAFTLPSAILMTVFALGFATTEIVNSAWVHGLLLASAAVIATAILDMIKTLAPDGRRLAFALACAAALIVVPISALAQLLVIAAGAIAGHWLAPRDAGPLEAGRQETAQAGDVVPPHRWGPARTWGFVFLALLALSFVPPVQSALGEAGRFYQAGALVFGGGHVVLPLLQTRFVTPGIVPNDVFLSGYAAAQAMPGPLFSFASYLGAVAKPVGGVAGAALGLISIYLPTFILLAAIVPVWDWLRHLASVRRALAGVNAAVIGLLIAALYRPIIVTTMHSERDVAIALLAFAALYALRWQPIFVVAGCAIAAGLVAR